MQICARASSPARAPQKVGQPVTAERTPSGLGAAPWGRGAIPWAWGGHGGLSFQGTPFCTFRAVQCVCARARNKLPIRNSHHRCSATLFYTLSHVLGQRRVPPSIVLNGKTSRDEAACLWCRVASVSCLLPLLQEQFLGVFSLLLLWPHGCPSVFVEY